MFKKITIVALVASSALGSAGYVATNNQTKTYAEVDVKSKTTCLQSREFVHEQTDAITDKAQYFIDCFLDSLCTINDNEISYEVISMPNMPMSSSSSKDDDPNGWRKDIGSSNVLGGIPDYTTSTGKKLLKTIKPGDIIYQPNSSLNHVAIIEGIYTFTYKGNNGTVTGPYIRMIEATVIDGPRDNRVMRSVFDSASFWDGCKIYRVTGATEQKIEGALNFARAQLGKGYGFSWGYDADNWWWYCSKLVAASYMSQGIKFAIAEKNPLEYTPNDLIKESCLYRIYLPNC